MSISGSVGNLEITVDDRWLSTECLFGDVSMSTVFPGGSDQLTWSIGTAPRRRFTPGADIRAWYGPVCVWAGDYVEPDPSSEQMAAVGAWQAASCPALDGSGNATKIPNTAVDTAITDGFLNWTRPNTIATTAVDIDTSQGPVTVGALLDAWALANNQYWWVDPYRRVLTQTADTTPTWATEALDGGLGFDLTNYASQFVGRYFNGTTYVTAIVDGPGGHGNVQKTVDLTGKGTLTPTKATNLLTNLFAKFAAVPAYTQSVGFAYGELLSHPGTVPVALETAAAGRLLRVNGGFELAQRLNNQLYLDVPIGRTDLTGGLLTMTPAQVAVRNLADYVAATPAHRLTA